MAITDSIKFTPTDHQMQTMRVLLGHRADDVTIDELAYRLLAEHESDIKDYGKNYADRTLNIEIYKLLKR